MEELAKTARLILQMAILVDCVCGSSCHLNTTSGKTGTSLEADKDVLETLPYSSQYACVASCKMNPRCDSVSFDRRTLECRLLGATAEPSQRMEKKQIATDVSKWEGSISGLCTRSSCGSREICWVDRQNRPLCYVPLMCPDLNQPANGSVEIVQSRMGTIARLRRDQDYSSCGGKHLIKCQSNGSWLWEQWNHICSRNAWHNASVPLRVSIRCTVEMGSTVEMIGTPLKRKTSREKINLSLFYRTQLLFHLSFCFQNGGVSQYVLMNIKTSGRWGKRQIYRKDFPLKFGREFNITIVVEDEQYRVMVDGTSRYWFKHRSPVRTIDNIAILKNVEVKTLRVIYAETSVLSAKTQLIAKTEAKTRINRLV